MELQLKRLEQAYMMLEIRVVGPKNDNQRHIDDFTKRNLHDAKLELGILRGDARIESRIEID
jgi:hypothetical protein